MSSDGFGMDQIINRRAGEARIIGIVPARMGSARFPGKVLARIFTRPMIDMVTSGCWPHVTAVATCDDAIAGWCDDFSVPSIRTSASHVRALDRVAEAARLLAAAPDDIVVCIQADEPLLRADEIRAVETAAKIEATNVGQPPVLLVRPIADAERADPNAVKAVLDAGGRMVYSTRAAVPSGWRLAGVFAMTMAKLQVFAGLPESPLERAESCDINRFIDHGVLPRAVKAARAAPSVDVPADIARVEAALRGAA